jgi:hypothetical protein
MTKYIIKTEKIEEGMYKHDMYDGNFNLVKPETTLENNKTAKDLLYYHNLSIVPFLRSNKIKSAKLEIEVSKNDS